jgi:hypothetical protein
MGYSPQIFAVLLAAAIAMNALVLFIGISP